MKTSFDKFMASNAVAESTNVELGAMKVELALIDQLKKEIADAISKKNLVVKGQMDISVISEKIQKEIRDYLSMLSNLSDTADDVRVAYKELGLNFESAKEFGDFRKAFEAQKEFMDYLSKIKSL